MEQTAFNPQNGRPETINIESTDESTNWFDESEDSHGILSINDLQTGILIKKQIIHFTSTTYSQADIDHDHGKAKVLYR